jgi:ribosomal protein S18 acetylase RimI-like enzyme
VTLEIRPAEPGDARALARVHVRAWQAAYRGLIPDAVLDTLSVDGREQRWREILDGPPGARTIVATSGGDIAGFCSVVAPARDDDLPPGAAEVAAIYVDPARWRAGVGRALLDAALDTLRADGAGTVVLWLLEGNDRALGFYEACGFRADGTAKTEPVGSVERVGGLTQARLRLAL